MHWALEAMEAVGLCCQHTNKIQLRLAVGAMAYNYSDCSECDLQTSTLALVTVVKA